MASGTRRVIVVPPLLLLLLLVVAAAEADYWRPQVFGAADGRACYQTAAQNPYVYFGSKTAYDAVAGKDLQTPADCRPMQVWMVARHGTRNPSRDTIEKLKKLHELKSMITADTTLCAEDVAAIRSWDINLTADNHYKLHAQGVEEVGSLAVRLKRQFPQIFNTPYTDAKFKIMTSHKSRARDSATAFFKSMFDKSPEKDFPIVEPSDGRLNLYKCKHSEDDDDDTRGQGEAEKFEQGPLVQSVVSRVSMAMGLKQNLSYENVSLMMDSCRYDRAWRVRSRPAWCAVFTVKDMEILEYAEDLKLYYTNGYGNPIGERMGCPIVKDLIDNFKSLARDRTGPLGIFYFGHSINLLSVVSRLGIGKDDTPLLSTNFEQMKNRKWRTSYIDPFTSNVIAVFYRCKNGNKAMILLNEHAIPVTKDQCRFCSWEPIEAQYDPITSDNQTCNLDMCKNSAVIVPTSLIITIIIAFTQYTKFTMNSFY